MPRPSPRSPEGDAVYRLTVRGRVGEGWRRWFDADALRPGEGTTEIVVRVADQAELLGRLRRAQDLNLHLVKVVLLTRPESDDIASGPHPEGTSSDETSSGERS